MAEPQPMDRVPRLWAAAYGTRGSAPSRLCVRALLRVVAFVRALAQADHHTFTSV